MSKKILIVTPRFPYPEAGADEQDRAEGIRQLKRLGYEVCVIAKCFDWQPNEEIETLWEQEGIPVTLVPYVRRGKPWRIWDRAAAEYAEPVIRASVEKALEQFRPDLVWFDYTYLWPLYSLVQKCQIPIAVRSINVESRHFLQEEGAKFVNYLKYFPKVRTEQRTARHADLLFSITPDEGRRYRSMGAQYVVNLPLRGLIRGHGTHTPRDVRQLHVFFSGSTYTVPHNRRSLEFVVKDIAPVMLRTYGDTFQFHITGAKFPENLRQYLKENVRYEGFVPDRESFLRSMDIAIAPSFFGAGMQQKIFEPIARGFPTITNPRGIAGYDFLPNKEFIAAENVDEYIGALERLRSLSLREELSRAAKKKAKLFFSQSVLDDIVRDALEDIL